jgi:polar amino acid transport system substrate-binding protein
VDEQGNYAGLDIELAKEVCRRMGMKPVFVALQWDQKDECLEDGEIDCIWSCFSMSGREDLYDWAGPYMCSRQIVAVKADSDIYTLSDLNDKIVAVMSSTMPESIFLNQENSDIPKVKYVYCMDTQELTFSALQAGYVDATAGHESVVRQYMDTMYGDYRILDEALQSVDVGIAFLKGADQETIADINIALDSMREDGTLAEILEKYDISADGGEGE